VRRYPAFEESAHEAVVETDDVRLNPGCELGFIEPVALATGFDVRFEPPTIVFRD
jgi:hypothetical protein